MNQTPHEITLLGDETKKSPISLASSMELDEDAIFEQIQVITTIEYGINKDLPN